MKSVLHLFFLLSVALFMVSCDDDVLTSAEVQPKVELNEEGYYDLGEVLSGVSSATKRLIVRNPHEGVLELQSIVLRGGEKSPFKINVDGMAGTVFDRPELLHIARGDSLFVLVEVAAPLQQESAEEKLEDFIDIQCNGRTTSIPLKALSRNAEILTDYTLTQDERWDADSKNKRIIGKLTIPEGVKLTIADSTRLYFHAGSMIDVYGTLIVQGAAGSPVRLLGDRLDKMFDNLYYYDMVGQWEGIHFHNTSRGNRFENADIKGLVAGIRVDSAELILRNILIRNSNQSLVQATASTLTMENCCLMNSGAALVELTGGAGEITHCTLANYQFWTYYPEQDMILRNSECKITNSIIFGNSEGPNIGLEYEQGEGLNPYLFDHCLLNAKGEDDDNFIATVWGEDPLFVLVDMPNYVCDPHLKEDSPARGKGTSEPVQRLPYDLDGKPRAAVPSIGCFE